MSFLNNIDTSTPLDSDNPVVLAAQIRELKETVKNILMVSMKNDGSLKSIVANGLGSDSVGSDQLTTGSVITEKIADEAVTAVKLADGSVTVNKIGAGAITAAKLGAQSVTGTKIAPNSITSAMIAEALSSAKIKSSASVNDDRAITSDHIRDGAVIDRTIFDVSVSKITGGVDGDFLYKTGGAWTAVSIAGALTYNPTTEQFDLDSQLKVCTVGDVKSRGASGGATTAGAWVERDLGELSDADSIITFSGNTFSLPQGKYLLFFKVPASNVGNHQARLFQDNGDATNEIPIWGSSAAASGVGVMSYSDIIGAIEITDDDKTFKIQHWCQNTVGANDLGVPASSDNTVAYGNHSEVYTQGYIVKLG